ncbi:unnamed protein product [Schistosoma margrebowiei]|uniref:Annexin n=1 Tax=Schistosoma margrebowiei TaxID=48269 RepID=A0A3P7ZXQ8_9TREM|nr:unnamed protein product [Schistosoma margrebowiei]
MDRLNIREKEIVEVMGRRPVVQRIAILQTYKSLYKDNLFAIFNSKLTGYLKDCMIALCYTPAEFDAIELHRAMRGTDTDEDTIIEILCTKTNEQIRRIRDVYPKLFDGCDLMNDVNNQITHPFKRIFMTLLKADRDEFTFVDRNIVQRDVEELFNTIQQNIRIDESKSINWHGNSLKRNINVAQMCERTNEIPEEEEIRKNNWKWIGHTLRKAPYCVTTQNPHMGSSRPKENGICSPLGVIGVMIKVIKQLRIHSVDVNDFMLYKIYLLTRFDSQLTRAFTSFNKN